MAFLNWTPAYSVGVAAMDADHQRLMGLVNEFRQAMGEGHGNDHVRAVLDSLSVYASSHFRAEEELMERHHYPGLEEHRRIHEELVLSLAGLRRREQSGNLGLSVAVAEFLRDWLETHILGADKDYAPYLQEAQAA